MVNVIVDFENNLIQTININNKNDVNFFEIKDQLGDTRFLGLNLLGNVHLNKNNKYNSAFFERYEGKLEQRIFVDLKWESVTNVFTISDEYRTSLDTMKIANSIFRIQNEIEQEGLSPYIKTECKLKNKYNKPNKIEKQEIIVSSNKKTKEPNKLWKAFKEVMKENGKEYFNAAVDAYYGTGGLKSSQHCVTTDAGGRIQIFCKSY